MALNIYLQQTQRLLNNPTGSLYNTTDLTYYINVARGQVAGEGECVRVYGAFSMVSGSQVYPLTSINVTSVSGVQGALNVRIINLSSGVGDLQLTPRPWEWFSTYHLSTAQSGNPTVWAQLGQGAGAGGGVGGSIYVWPTPNSTGPNLRCDTSCYPINLASDTDPEAIPYPWTDAIPYFAAYLAYLNAQRTEDANKMLERYEFFTRRARQLTTPTVLPGQYPGSSGAQAASQQVPVTGAGGGMGGGGGA